MTVADIAARIVRRIDDDELNSPDVESPTPNSTTDAQVLDAINEGEQLFCFITLCLESTVPLTLAAATCWSTFRSLIPDFLVPLRLELNGIRLRPATLTQLDAEDDAWEVTPGKPAQYLMEGFNLLGVTPQSPFGVVSQMTYARSAALLAQTDSPEIPEQFHPLLVDFGVYWIRAGQGGQALARGNTYFNRFLDGAQEHGDYVRSKSRAARYDTLPFELALFDRSLLGVTA